MLSNECTKWNEFKREIILFLNWKLKSRYLPPPCSERVSSQEGVGGNDVEWRVWGGEYERVGSGSPISFLNLIPPRALVFIKRSRHLNPSPLIHTNYLWFQNFKSDFLLKRVWERYCSIIGLNLISMARHSGRLSLIYGTILVSDI